MPVSIVETSKQFDVLAEFGFRDRHELTLPKAAYPNLTSRAIRQYANSLIAHIEYVRRAGRVLGIPAVQLLKHDLTKWDVDQFPHYVEKFHLKGEKAELADDGFQLAWLRHENAEPHHWGHWVLRTGKDAGSALPMPTVYAEEMVSDWHGAGRAYQDSWDISDWFNAKYPTFNLHSITRLRVEMAMTFLGYEQDDNGKWFAGSDFVMQGWS